MTTHNTQEQDLRTALEAERAELQKANDEAPGWGAAVGARAERIREIDSRLAAPPRPVDVERVALGTREIIVEACFDPGHFIGARGSRTTDEWRADAVLAALASPAHSPDKAVTREGLERVDVRAEADAYEFRADEGDYTPTENERAMLEDFGNGLMVRVGEELAPKPTGTEAGRGVVPEHVALSNCPVGLFLADSGTLCLKTEYGNNEGRIDAYIVETGEFFWGYGPQSIERQRNERVRPVPLEQIADAITLPFRAATPTPPVSPTPDSTGPAEVKKIGDAPWLAYRKWQEETKPGYWCESGFRAGYAAGLAALTPPAPIADPSPDSTGQGDAQTERVRHVKRGTEYEVLGEAEAQVSSGDITVPVDDDSDQIARELFDGEKITIYRDPKNGKLWCRFTDEFRDGRFVTVSQGDAQTQEDGR